MIQVVVIGVSVTVTVIVMVVVEAVSKLSVVGFYGINTVFVMKYCTSIILGGTASER